ncbi:hypothetical protein Aduo_014252 [Ancylostoma duodenale]
MSSPLVRCATGILPVQAFAMQTSLLFIFLVTAFEKGVYSADDKFSQLPNEKKQELLEAFSRSDVNLVHEKLTDLRKKWMEKLKSQSASEDLRQPLQRIPEKMMMPARTIPGSDGPTVLPIHEINRDANLSEFMYQSDMVLTLAQVEQIGRDSATGREKRQAYRDMYYPNTIWDKTVYYYFDPTATNPIKTVFLAAAEFWRKYTCITFEENRSAPNRIRVFKGEGCYSYVGRVGGQQDLSLGKGCESVGTAAHELGHALGFFHAQSRVDRDDAIRIMVANIQPDYVDQFDKESARTNYNYGMPYDYGSIMQYGATSASRNGRATMIARQSDYQETMGSDMVAFYDVSMMNEHYNCKVRCNTGNNAQCQNGGFANPNDCSVCICPSGYGGKLCNERPPGCGETFTAGPTFTQFTSVLGDRSSKTKIDFDKCNYWIQAPSGKLVQVRLDDYQGYSIDGCIYAGVEVKSHPDQLRTGYRMCSGSDVESTLTAASNLLPIITFNRYGLSSIALSYRYVDENQQDREAAPITATTRRPVTRTTRRPKPITKCVNYFYDCNILAFFGFCDAPNVRQQCNRACGLC